MLRILNYVFYTLRTHVLFPGQLEQRILHKAFICFFTNFFHVFRIFYQGHWTVHFTLILKIADNVFYTRFSGQIFSSHFLLKRIPNDAFYTNSKNVLYTVVESMVYFTLVSIMYFPLVKLRFVIYTNHFQISCIFH